MLRNQLNDRWESKPERERRQAGFDPQGKNLYQSVEVMAHFQVIGHDVAVSFKVSQAATGTILDSGTIEAPFEGRFRDGDKAPTVATLEAEAIGKVVEGIALRLTPARKKIAVLLPKGRLEGFAALAGAGQWERYRDAVAALAPSPDGEDEAYRQFALATANEALAYAATVSAERLEHLKLAESQYQAAIAAHPAEKLFAKKSEAERRNDRRARPARTGAGGARGVAKKRRRAAGRRRESAVGPPRPNPPPRLPAAARWTTRR